MTHTIDLNADLGEAVGDDAAMMSLVTSANICCGFHAGDAATTRAALELAREHHVAVGAHPGYADREQFGRRELTLTPREIGTLCFYQIGAILGLARAVGVTVQYLKPHGALYNQACREPDLAGPIVAAALLHGLAVMALPGSSLAAAAQAAHVPFIAEGFADRRYRDDGSLVPRSETGAFLHDPREAVQQIEWLIQERGVRSICVHGDNPEAVAFTQAIRAELLTRGFRLKAVQR